MRTQIINTIFKVSRKKDAFDQLEKLYLGLVRKELSEEIVHVGIMPEVFDHDSSEEKMWSKFSDIILAACLNQLGLKSQVIRKRGNSADVYSITNGYTIVSDAKCFRLSRTAKNQKDFKVSALDDWRKEDTYALLVAPLYQYPVDKSQIYPQAIINNVTLLSYTHLKFLLDKTSTPNLLKLWETGKNLSKTLSTQIMQTGIKYWEAIDATICEISDTKLEELKKYKQDEIVKTRELGQEGTVYWQNKISEFSKLSRDEAIRLLIKSQKIEQKIQTIEKAISKKYAV